MFKIGDKVYLREDIWYNSTEESNPLNVLGVITGHGNMLPFKVDWENGEINVYAECDLMSEEEYLRHHASISQSVI